MLKGTIQCLLDVWPAYIMSTPNHAVHDGTTLATLASAGNKCSYHCCWLPFVRSSQRARELQTTSDQACLGTRTLEAIGGFTRVYNRLSALVCKRWQLSLTEVHQHDSDHCVFHSTHYSVSARALGYRQ